MNLRIFAGQYVLVQFKQPYQFYLPYAEGGKPMPMSVTAPGAPPPAPGQEPARTMFAVPFVMGKVKVVATEDGEGRVDDQIVIQFMDPKNTKMEVAIAADMIFSASAVSPDTIITP